MDRMNRDTAQFRREKWQAGYKSIPRDEYIIRAHEFCKRGEDLPGAKINEDIVREIRANRHGLTDKKQAEKYGISESLVLKIRHRERWSHVQ
jgi:hypothetical protein